jgi:predicted membrane protein
MDLHTIFAVFFCFLPALVNVFVQDPVSTLRIAGVILGIQLVLHGALVTFLPTTKGLFTVFPIAGCLFGFLQFGSFIDWGAQREFEFYIAGIIFHVLQSGTLFLLLTLPVNKTTSD